jgi:ABC-type molybdenum transport system ATPase subunit/photorepair protein PhrA
MKRWERIMFMTLEKLAKVEELARRGVGGEAKTAKKIAARMRKKLGLVSKERTFKFTTKWKEKFVGQAVLSALGVSTTHWKRVGKGYAVIEMTDRQYEEVKYVIGVFDLCWPEAEMAAIKVAHTELTIRILNK